MASPSGTSSGSSLLLPTSGSEEDLHALMMDQKKRKRMISNRESARRSRMRKQKHLDDLTAQANQLRKENSQILSSLTLTTQQCFAVEADNSVLRTQTMELTNRLQSLDEILLFLNGSNTIVRNGFLIGPWSSTCTNQPIMASAADNLLQH